MPQKAKNARADLPPISSHFNGKRFRNMVPRRLGFWALLRWIMNRNPGEWPDWVETSPGPRPPDSSQDLRITYVNHSTFLVQVENVNILTDPVWSKRASPLQWLGPRRRHPPGIRFDDLPPIHAVLLSHDHYDHMDIPTLRRLAREHQPAIYTGLRNTRTLRRHGIGDVVELDWWQNAGLAGFEVTAVPAQHFSGRGLFDRDAALWCGFVLQGQSTNLYFAGDSGMGPHFEMIRDRFPGLDVAILPIGAFRPEWFMGEVHLSPKEAVGVHLLLEAQVSLASHFGIFPLADDGQDEPVQVLQQTLAETDLQGTEFLVLKSGEGRNFDRTTELRSGLMKSSR